MLVYLVHELSVGRIRVRPLVVKDATSLTFLRKVMILVALLVSPGVIFDSSSSLIFNPSGNFLTLASKYTHIQCFSPLPIHWGLLSLTLQKPDLIIITAVSQYFKEHWWKLYTSGLSSNEHGRQCPLLNHWYY